MAKCLEDQLTQVSQMLALSLSLVQESWRAFKYLAHILATTGNTK